MKWVLLWCVALLFVIAGCAHAPPQPNALATRCGEELTYTGNAAGAHGERLHSERVKCSGDSIKAEAWRTERYGTTRGIDSSYMEREKDAAFAVRESTQHSRDTYRYEYGTVHKDKRSSFGFHFSFEGGNLR